MIVLIVSVWWGTVFAVYVRVLVSASAGRAGSVVLSGYDSGYDYYDYGYDGGGRGDGWQEGGNVTVTVIVLVIVIVTVTVSADDLYCVD